MSSTPSTGSNPRRLRSPPVIVVGAGIGGLVAALELAARGVAVLILERAGAPGGKMREVSVDGTRMDAGPTVFTMRWVFDELFDAIGESLSSHITLQPLSVLARHAWNSGGHLDLHADMRRSADAIGAFAGASAARGFLAFCDRAAAIYKTLEGPFLRDSRPTPASLASRVGWRGLPGLLDISPFSTLWHELGRYFPDPRLRQLFGRYATYCGSSPFSAPATLMLVAHVEQAGVWMVDGGMHRLAAALAALAVRKGASVRYGADVKEVVVQNGRATGVKLADGETIDAAAVVFNGDCAALAAGLLGPRASGSVAKSSPRTRSLSALTLAMTASASGFPLARHSVFFSSDYAREFEDIALHQRLPSSPTVYLCAQDRGNAEDDVPTGDERLLAIINAPANGDRTDIAAAQLEQCEERAFALFQHCGLTLKTRATQVTTPAQFERLFPATGGALYGQASHGWKASFSRPGSRSRLPGLYLAGGSVHPGPGVPMAALSGRQAAASVLHDLARSPT